MAEDPLLRDIIPSMFAEFAEMSWRTPVRLGIRKMPKLEHVSPVICRANPDRTITTRQKGCWMSTLLPLTDEAWLGCSGLLPKPIARLSPVVCDAFLARTRRIRDRIHPLKGTATARPEFSSADQSGLQMGMRVAGNIYSNRRTPPLQPPQGAVISPVCHALWAVGPVPQAGEARH